jgi:hypothetical protein
VPAPAFLEVGPLQAVVPVNTVLPVVSGTISVGQTLTTTNGTWTDDLFPVYTYKWQRDVAGNSVFSNIGGATASTYALVDADDGCHVRSVVTDTDESFATSVAASAVGLIIEPAATNSVAPAESGTTTVGQTLSCTTGTWANMAGSNPTYSYQWQRDVAGNSSYGNIGAATASTYALVTADDTCHVRCVVTAHNTNAATPSANSNASAIVTLAIPTNSVAPVASGTAQVGRSVSCTTGTWTSTPSSYAYQWQDSADGSTGWANIASATSSSYLIAAGELNDYLRCNVTATNDGGTSSATPSNVLGPDIAAASTGAGSGGGAAAFFHLLGLGG